MKNAVLTSTHRSALLFAMIGMLIFCSCKKEKTPVNLTMIPRESSMVISLDLEALAKKANMADFRKTELYKNISQELGSKQQTLKLIWDDPEKSGIKFKKAFIFATDSANAGLTLELKSASDFESMITRFAKEENLTLAVQKGAGCKYVVLPGNDSSSVIWDDNKALCVMHTPTGEALRMFGTTPESGILSNKDFASFYEKRKEVACWVSVDRLYKMAGSKLSNPLLTAESDMLKGINYHINAEFKEGSVEMTCEMTPHDQAGKLVKSFISTPNDEMLKYIPGKSYLLAKMSVNMKALIALLSKDKNAFEKLPPETLSVVNSLKGSFAFNLFNFADAGMPMPQFVMAATVNDQSIYNLLTKKALAENKLHQFNGYAGITEIIYSYYIAQKGNLLMASNSEDVIKNFAAGKPIENNLLNSEHKAVENTPAYFYMNLDLDTYPSSLVALLDQLGSGTAAKFRSIMFFKDMECSYINGATTSKCVLRLKETKGNSLAVILKNINSFVGK
jgi:hypothetical protein